MDRLACVDLPAFPLQLLLRRHPDWRRLPAVVVDEDRPQGVVQWANEQARSRGVLPGHRYAHALSLARELRADVISPAQLAEGVERVTEALRKYSPDVEASAANGDNGGEPGVFWLDAAGLLRIYRSLDQWAGRIHRTLADEQLESSIVVGFTRFCTYAVARARYGKVTVFRDPELARDTARKVPLERLGLAPALRDELAKLGVTTVGSFLRLPAGGLLRRYGAEAHRLHQLAAGERWDPLRPKSAREPIEQHVLFDDAEANVDRLMFALRRPVDRIMDVLAGQHSALGALFIEFTLDRTDHRHIETIRPAEPTLDARTIMRLIHLRLESSPPRTGVIELRLGAEDVPATREQLELFSHKPRRDLRAANEALARLRAELGNEAIVHAALKDGHLPEARFEWRPVQRVVPAAPRDVTVRPLVRRVHRRPLLLPPQNSGVRDDGWLLRGLEHGAVTNIVGPYIVSGGWWRSEVHREYHFAETRRGDWLWVYFDRHRRRWFLQGEVS